MNTNSFLISDDNNYKLCKMILKILNCNLMWIIHSNDKFNILVTDQSILQYYLDNKYYLHDPNIKVKTHNKKSSWKVSLGTDCNTFKKNGFLYDLYKIFHVEEFVSIEKQIGTERYCFRFFTNNNRFVFMNKLLNNMPIIKQFISYFAEKLKVELHKQPGINIAKLT